jgi:hypothetical protein
MALQPPPPISTLRATRSVDVEVAYSIFSPALAAAFSFSFWAR